MQKAKQKIEQKLKKLKSKGWMQPYRGPFDKNTARRLAYQLTSKYQGWGKKYKGKIKPEKVFKKSKLVKVGKDKYQILVQ